MNPTFELDCAGLVPACAAIFRRTGRVHIPGALKAAGAAALHGALTGEAPWALVLNAGDTVYDMPAEAGATAAELARLAAERGRTGFQFLFESIRLMLSVVVGGQRRLEMNKLHANGAQRVGSNPLTICQPTDCRVSMLQPIPEWPAQAFASGK